ncbi:50S ribosomal protein L10 [Balneolaceae bacterium ANBcel3]|nr:50S ribosomal protein L10 [Balneolaceae bacterium ANBcel3]
MATLAEKKEIVAKLVDELQEADALYLTNFKGMSVAELNDLRGEFRKNDIPYKVYNNTLFRRALKETGRFEGIEDHTVNETAYSIVKGDVAVPAKVLKKILKDSKKPEFKAAAIEDVVYASDQLDYLAAMKSKEEVIGDIIGLLLSPISNVVGGLQSQGSNIVGAVKTIAEKED